jgi:hydrophobe/amphiphile efflux-1 (HAE1) family protein
MSMNVSAWSIRKPVPSLVAFVVLTILGWFSFTQLPITKFPNVDIPIISVQVMQPGAAPSELETQVTKKVEDAIASVNGIKHIISSVSEGVSSTTIEFRLETNTDRALNDVKDAIARVRSDLPRTIEEPIVSRLDVVGLPIMTYAVSSANLSLEQLSWYVDDVIARKLQSLKGVGAVERIGGVDREIRIELKPDRLLALGITAGDISRQLRQVSSDVAGGRSEVAGREQSIRTLAGARTVADLANTMISLPGGRKVRLGELGAVRDTAAEQRRFARHNGRPVVGFGIKRAKGESEATVAKKVETALAEIRKDRPDVSVDLIDTKVQYTVGNYEAAMKTLIEGALLSIVVVLLFLRDWRATLITSLALPLSIIPTYFVIHTLGFSLNLVSLLGITLATGILVDDAIVEIENIVRHMRMGKSPYRASLEAADEIGLAVMAISLTIIAVFMPVSFMSGIAGQYFKQFGLTVAIAVFFSLLVARFITPLLAAYFMRSHKGKTESEGFIMRGYVRVVGWSVRHRFVTVILGLGIFAGSIMSISLLPKGFMPAIDEARLTMGVELPPGSRIEDTIAKTDAISARLRKLPEIASIFVDGGKIGLGAPQVQVATLTLALVHKTKRTKTQRQLQGEIGKIAQTFPDIRFWFINENGQRAVSLGVSGNDPKAVEETAVALTSQMKRIPVIANVVSTAALDRPEIRVVPKTDRAAELGVTTDAIADAVRVATIGDVDANLAKFNAGDRLLPIRVRLTDQARQKFDVLSSLRVRTASGASVPLSAVADIRFDQGPSSITRYDRVRRIAVEADLQGTDALGEVLEMVQKLPATRNAPAGVSVKPSGDSEVMNEVFAGFAQAMGAGLMMVLAVLILLFGSVIHPITILLSLPLSIGGVIGALYVTNNSVSMPVVIGILMLIGIVTKNAIMLVDFAIERIHAGMSRYDALVDAGRKRARPIVMTTIAMVAGMVPSALGLGDGGEFRSPMAIGVIGGLIVSTVLSLIFVPAIFTLMDDVGRFFWFLFGRFIGPTDEYDADEPRPADASVLAAMASAGAGGAAVASSHTSGMGTAAEKKDDDADKPLQGPYRAAAE